MVATSEDAGEFEYFDEAYFEGGDRGTAYINYRVNAARNPIFLQMARAIKEVFRPRRCLEIGCATGVVVSHLNRMGIEAHGIDVSSWAVENREHPNVIECAAHELPYPDGHFDLVYSAHAIEHIPVHLKDASFRDISRVARGGFQFHMLPIIGDGPYTGDPDYHIRELQGDPTHVLLHNREWWIAEWERLGWRDHRTLILFDDDTEQFELSGCQFIISDQSIDLDIIERAFDWNRAAAQRLFAARRKGGVHPLPTDAQYGSELIFDETEEWRDVVLGFESEVDLSGAEIIGIVTVDAEAPINLRLAVLSRQEDGTMAVAESWQTFQPGRNLLHLYVDKLDIQAGTPDLTRAQTAFFGGMGKDCRAIVDLVLKQGDQVTPLPR